VVFVLDTTGSMSGLIEGAKQKIWAIANQILNGQPRPELRIGLIGYRDLGDAYVTKRYELTENIDDVYRNLHRFSAAGGGDTPEDVNKALHEAITMTRWRSGQKVLRQIYLVGDAPPHEGRNGLYSQDIARHAAREGILINAVRCGTLPRTALLWKQYASLTGGIYASIRQDGAMVAIRTPLDEELARLNAELSSTLLGAGKGAARRATRSRAMSNAAMGARLQAESAIYRARSGFIDSNDLLGQLKRGRKLDSFRKEELPASVAALPRPARQAYVAKVARRRAKLKKRINALASKREAFIKANRPRGDTSFDDTIGAALKKQGAKAGIAY
jgi:hypothetical protein